MIDRFVRNRRRAQSGTTLVELLVSVTIIGLALVLLIGTFSTGLLDAALTKRNSAMEAVVQYELEKIHAGTFNASAQPYSECFATENTSTPLALGNFQDPCPDTTYTLRADVTWAAGSAPDTQVWTVTVVTWPGAGQVGSPVSLLKIDR